MCKSLFLIIRNSFLIFSLFLFCAISLVEAAPSNFYYLNEKWEKSNAAEETKGDAVDSAFAAAFSGQIQNLPIVARAPTLRKTLTELVRSGSFEIEQYQSLLVTTNGGVSKFISTDEGIVTLETADSGLLRVLGTGIGKTFVHVWDASGRSTFEVRVRQPAIVITRAQIEQLEKFEKSRPFKIIYENDRNAFYSGDKFQEKRRTTLDFRQNFKVEGDTPYGALSMRAQSQKNRTKHIIDDIGARLEDGQIGPFKNFDLAVGDTEVRPDFIVFPQGRIRGADLVHRDPAKRVDWDAFYGREQSSIVGVLTPGLVSKRTIDSFLSGDILDFKLNEDARMRTGVFTGHGRSRADSQNKFGAANELKLNLGPHTKIESETDFDDEHFASRHALISQFDNLRFKHEVRDISKKFFTMLGAPGQQGEIGYRADLSANPSDQVYFSGHFNLFRDRLIPNPEELDALNRHTDLLLRLVPYDNGSLAFSYQDFDDTGRVGPTKQRTFGVQWNHKQDLWNHAYTFFSRYQNRESIQLTNSIFNYEQDQAILGLYTSIFWGINFSIQQEWNDLEERNALRHSYPRALVYSLDTSRQIEATPFTVNLRLRIRDEEDTESPNSFMGGEDTTEVSGGLYYRPDGGREIFLTGSFTNFKPESLAVTAPRIEAQFLTGMKYTFDTGIRWSAVGSFDGTVFKDVNGDGIYQSGEPGIPGMVVQATGGREAKTDEKGYYRLDSVVGKRVNLTLDSSHIPYGYSPTSPVQRGAEIIQNKTQQINFSLAPRSEITGILFNDLNGNGKYDLTDVGLKRVRVSLEGGVTVRSNDLGVYSFSNVVAGEHTVSLVLATLPPGYLPVEAPKKTITVFEGIRFELNFAVRAMRALTGRVFLDKNKNGLFDEEETPLADIRIRLGEFEADSDGEGWYLFESVPKGHFELFTNLLSVPAGFTAPEKTTVDFPVEPMTMTDVNIALREN